MNLSCVMVVDDSEPEQFLCEIVIKNYNPNIKILQAYDGQEALDVLDSAKQQPDIIFLDINMPGMDGYEFLKVYGKRKEKTSAIIIMLTSSDQEKDRERSMAYKNVKNYLTKPLEVLDLEKAEKLLLNGLCQSETGNRH